MSRASAAVRFSDGTIKYGIYDGTVDILWRQLFDTIDQAWDAYRGGDLRDPDGPLPEGEPVEIYEDYGGGSHWPGRATRECVTSLIDTWSDEFHHAVVEPGLKVDGQPEWLDWGRG